MDAWDFSEPFVHTVAVTQDAIDVMGHVNNVRYLHWLEEAAWLHSQALGLGWAVYQELGCGVVAQRHEIDYLAPAFAGDALEVGTWCTGHDGRLRLRRHYQVRRVADGRTCVRGQTLWVSVDLRSGRPRRMPALFAERFVAPPDAPHFAPRR